MLSVMTTQKYIMLNYISQAEKDKYCMTALYMEPKSVKLLETGNTVVASEA